MLIEHNISVELLLMFERGDGMKTKVIIAIMLISFLAGMLAITFNFGATASCTRAYYETIEVHDVAVTNITAWPTAVPQGEPIYINVTVENQGNFTETFSVTVSASHWGTGTVIPIGTKTVYDLSPNASKTVNFVWDTTGAPLGTYDLTAEAILPEDDDPEDNILIAKGIVAGICRPYHAREMSILELLLSMAPVGLILVAFGMVTIGLFEIVGSVKPPWRLSKRRLFYVNQQAER